MKFIGWVREFKILRFVKFEWNRIKIESLAALQRLLIEKKLYYSFYQNFFSYLYESKEGSLRPGKKKVFSLNQKFSEIRARGGGLLFFSVFFFFHMQAAYHLTTMILVSP